MIKAVIIVLVFPLLWKFAESVQCYFCNNDKTVGLPKICQDFEELHKYVVDCPDSTVCFKKIIKLEMSNGLSTTSIIRGCASQLQSGEQEKINGKWQRVHRIHEAYDEGCSLDSRHGLPTKTINCYCHGDLCNRAQVNTNAAALIVLLPFLALIFS